MSTSEYTKLLADACDKEAIRMKVKEIEEIKFSIRNLLTEFIEKNYVFTPEENAEQKSAFVWKALFNLYRGEMKYLADGDDPLLLPPMYAVTEHFFIESKENKDDLIRHVQNLCVIPPDLEEEYENWTNETWKISKNYDAVKSTVLWLAGVVWNCGARAYKFFGVELLKTGSDEIINFITMRTVEAAKLAEYSVMGCALNMAVTVFTNLYMVLRRERSNRRVYKSLIDDVTSVLAGSAAGYQLSIALAPFTGGWSLLVGAVGGAIATSITYLMSDRVTSSLLEIPRDETDEKAYRALGCNLKSDEKQIRKEYRQKSRQFHPDKFDKGQNGEPPTETEKLANKVKFLKVQAALAMIEAQKSNDKEVYKKARKDFEKLETEEYAQNKIWIENMASKIMWIWSRITGSVEDDALPPLAILPYTIFEDEENALDEGSKKVD